VTEGERIIEVLTALQSCNRDDGERILALHAQLPDNLSTAVMCYGVEATLAAIRDDPELLNHVGPMRQAR
jgi:hypothetical protein